VRPKTKYPVLLIEILPFQQVVIWTVFHG